MRYIFFLFVVVSCLFAKGLLAHGQPVPVTNDMGVSTPSVDVNALLKKVEALEAAAVQAKTGNKTPLFMLISGIIAFALKWVVDFFKSIPQGELSDRAKDTIPWILAVLGVAVGITTYYTTDGNWQNAIILGGGVPGAILMHELTEALRSHLKRWLSKPPSPPENKKPDIAPVAPAALVLALVGLGLGLSGCTPAQTTAWKKIGGLVAQQCAIPGAQQALVDVVNDAGQPGATAQSVAEAVAASDGVAAALCAASVLFSHIGDLTYAKLSPQDAIAVDALHYIQAHADDLAKKIEARRASK